MQKKLLILALQAIVGIFPMSVPVQASVIEQVIVSAYSNPPAGSIYPLQLGTPAVVFSGPSTLWDGFNLIDVPFTFGVVEYSDVKFFGIHLDGQFDTDFIVHVTVAGQYALFIPDSSDGFESFIFTFMDERTVSVLDVFPEHTPLAHTIDFGLFADDPITHGATSPLSGLKFSLSASSVHDEDASTVPEPGGLLLLGVGLAAMVVSRRLRQT